MKPQQQTKKHRIPWKDFFIAVGLLIVLLGIFIAVLITPGDAGPITRAANTFKPDSDWKLVKERITPPVLGCFMQVCPEVYREWSVKKDLSKAEFELLLRQSGLNWRVMHDCVYSEEGVGTNRVCSTGGVIDEFRVELDMYKYPETPEETEIIQSVRSI